MGSILSKVFTSIFGEENLRILILGLDNAGKTTILYKIHSGQVIQTVPTVGFNVESVQFKNLKFQVWDLGGQTSLRPYWRCYYQDTNAVVFVVDSSDESRMDIAKQELDFMMKEEELKNVPVVVLANKQDLPNALNEAQISDLLGLSEIKSRDWSIFKVSGINGTGLEDAFSWVADSIKK